MADALDVLVRIGVENGTQSGLDEVTQSLNKQSNIIKELQGAIDKLAPSQQSSSQKTVTSTKATNDEYQKLYNTIKNLQDGTVQYEKTIGSLQQAQKKLKDDFAKSTAAQVAEINNLKTAQKAQQEAFNTSNAKQVKEIKLLTTELDTLKNKISELATKSKQEANSLSTTLAKIKEGFIQGLGVGAGFGIANILAQGIQATRSLISESTRLATEAEGVQKAFDRLNAPNLLENLRAATKGTVSDLELMKQAVQFKNFGLPLEQLAKGLEFARIRAKETGQSVDFLVQSIVTGIGRQSPLILDNLGINARRVREEFQRTGDFALAAFKIIQEETEKSGTDLETFGERVQKINAQLDNQKVKFGQYLTEYSGFLLELGDDITDIFDEGFLDRAETNSSRYIRLLNEAGAATEKLRAKAAFENQLFSANFSRFADEYSNADQKLRGQIENQADKMYQSLIEGARSYYANDTAAYNSYFAGLKNAYTRLTAFFSGAKINIKSLTPDQLKGLTKEELDGVNDQIKNARNALTANDTAEINRLNRLSEETSRLINTIGGANFNKNIDVLKKRAEELSALRKKVSLEFRQINLDIIADEKKAASTTGLSPLSEATDGLVAALKSDLEELTKDFLQTLPKDQADQLARDIEAAYQKRQKEAREKALREQRIGEVLSTTDSVNTSIQATGAVIQSFLQTEQAKTDIAISEQQKRVDNAKEGNAMILAAESERLDRLLEKRRKNADEQQAINLALTVSQGLLNTANAIGAAIEASDKSNIFTFIGSIAAAVAAIAGTVVGVNDALSQADGFKKGGYTGDGSADDEAGIVHKGEFVMNKKTVDKFGRNFFEDIHAGRMPMAVNYQGLLHTHNAAQQGMYDMKRLEGKFDALLDKFDRGTNSVNVGGEFVQAEFANFQRNKLVIKSSRRF